MTENITTESTTTEAQEKEVAPEIKDNVKQAINPQSTSDSLAANLVERRRLTLNNTPPTDAKKVNEASAEEKTEAAPEKRASILDIAKKPTAPKEVKEPVVHSEEAQKEIDNYKKQVNDIKSNFHKTNIQNKLFNKKLEDLYNSGDIDEDIKNNLTITEESIEPIEPVVTEEEQSIYDWDDLMNKASDDLDKRYEYTKDDNIDKYSAAFMHHLYTSPKDKGMEIQAYLKEVAKTESVEKAVTAMLELGEHSYNNGMKDFFDNDGDVKKMINLFQKKMQTTDSELTQLREDKEFLTKELSKYKEVYVPASKDYKSSGMNNDGSGGRNISALMRAKRKT